MIHIPGTKLSLRVFDRVETTDPQYDIVDFGVQYEDGAIDSLAVGGAFSSLKRACANLDRKAAEKEAVASDA